MSYIEREALKTMFSSSNKPLEAAICSVIDSAPAADVAPVAHGRWKYYRKQNKGVCTNCSFERDLDADFGAAVSCPNCGAEMGGEKHE